MEHSVCLECTDYGAHKELLDSKEDQACKEPLEDKELQPYKEPMVSQWGHVHGNQCKNTQTCKVIQVHKHHNIYQRQSYQHQCLQVALLNPSLITARHDHSDPLARVCEALDTGHQISSEKNSQHHLDPGQHTSHLQSLQMPTA